MDNIFFLLLYLFKKYFSLSYPLFLDNYQRKYYWPNSNILIKWFFLYFIFCLFVFPFLLFIFQIKVLYNILQCFFYITNFFKMLRVILFLLELLYSFFLTKILFVTPKDENKNVIKNPCIPFWDCFYFINKKRICIKRNCLKKSNFEKKERKRDKEVDKKSHEKECILEIRSFIVRLKPV